MTFRYHAALRVAPAIALDLAATCWAKPPPSVIWLAAVVSQKVSSLSPCPPAACSQWRGQSNPVLKHEPFHVRPQLWTRHGSPHILSLQAQKTKKTKQKGNALERPNIAIFFSFPQESLFCFFWVHPKIYSSKAGRSGEFISTVTMRSTQETISPDAVSRLKVN